MGHPASYDGENNVVGFTDSVVGAWETWVDQLDRIYEGTATAGIYSGLNYQYMYDSFGDATRRVFWGGDTTAPVPPQESPTYNANNQIVGLSYDASGNVTDDGLNQYLYDAEGRLCAVNPYGAVGDMTGYVYDGEGNRIAKGTITTFSCDITKNGFAATNYYVYGPNGEVLAESDGNFNVIYANAFLNGHLLATFTADGNLHYNFTDWVGTKRVVASAGGTTEETCLSLPFGDGLNCSGPDVSELHFTGKQRDSESGNDYFGARYYASSMGRFLSPDEPFYSGQLDNPQDLNLYSYVHNNPLSNVDPDGHDVWLCATGASQCYHLTDDQWKALLASNDPKQTGIQVSGTGIEGTGTITCGGQACGQATYFEPGLQDESGSELMGIAGGMAIGKVVDAVAGTVAGWFGRGATEAATDAASGAGTATVQDILQGATPEGGSRANIFSKPGGVAQATKDFNSLDGTAVKAGNVMIKDLPGGQGRAVLRTDPSTWSNGRPSLDIQPTGGGSKATAIRYNP